MMRELLAMLDYGMCAVRWLVCVTTVLLLTGRGGLAELVFHTRNAKDQEEYPGLPKAISTKDEAKMYLEKYGYLNCGQGSTEERQSSQQDDASDNSSKPCTDENIRSAMKKLQEHFNLPQTGEFDELTKKIMNEGRCGNSDDDEPAQPPASQVNLERPEFTATFPEPEFNSRIKEANGHNFISQRRSRRSLIDILRTPLITEGKIESPVRAHFDKDVRESMIQNALRNKLESRKSRKSNIFADVVQKYHRKRRRRSAATERGRFNIADGDITWQLPSQYYSSSLPESQQKVELAKAFRMWSEVIPANFREANYADITALFGKGRHPGCTKDFDGKGGELAHSWTAGDIHFDDHEHYSPYVNENGVYFLMVAVHEIGHVLGLRHIDRPDSIMYPMFQKVSNTNNYELSPGDRKYVQSIYGACRGKFDIVFDWLREIPHTNEYTFNTYFFRGDHYWMYENSEQRPRYGDPLHIEPHWEGVPRDVDAYTQVKILVGSSYHLETYFFKGSYVYLYDDEARTVAPGYPKTISEKFGTSRGSSTEPIPNNLDAALYDNEAKVIYFFKDQWVWTYQVGSQSLVDNSCCVSKKTFSEMFPGDQNPDNLNGFIDTAYYSFYQSAYFIFKGEDVYNMYRDANTGALVIVKLPKPWNGYWNDICDVA